MSRMRPHDPCVAGRFQTCVAYSRWGLTRVLYTVNISNLSLEIRFRQTQAAVFLAFPIAFRIWRSQENFSVVSTPRSLSFSVYGREYSPRKYSGRAPEPMCSTLHFWSCTLKRSSQSFCHLSSVLRSSCVSSARQLVLMSFRSSANSEAKEVSLSGKSLIRIKNKRGPRTEPYGTPEGTFLGLERPSPILT